MPHLARGIVAEREYTEEEWPKASAEQRRDMTQLVHPIGDEVGPGT